MMLGYEENKLADGNWKFVNKNFNNYLESGAIFSQQDWENSDYRYSLWRVWNYNLPRLTFIMLNASLGNHLELTKTSNFCHEIAQNGLKINDKIVEFGSLEVVNLFAFRTSKPKELKAKGEEKNVIGIQNDNYIKESLKNSKAVVAAGGCNGSIKIVTYLFLS